MPEIFRFWILPVALLAAWVASDDSSVRVKSAATATTPDNPSDSCPVTKPPSPAFIPPAPYPSQPSSGTFWFGTEKLWTLLPADGTWRLLHSDKGFGQKLFWWREGYDWTVEPQPKLIVTAKRLDTSAPAVSAPRASTSNGYRREDWKSFMVVGVDVPTPGCWQITGRYDSDELRFVVRVAPPH